MRKGGLYLALGDSITWTQVTVGPDLYASRLAAAIRSNYGNIRHVNKGLGGINSSELANPKFMRWAMTLVPDLVTIGIGMNDAANQQVLPAAYEANLGTVIDFLRVRNPAVRIILCTPSGTSEATRTPYIAAYRTSMQTVATNKNVAICTFHTAVSDANIATYSADGIHPNSAGHGLLYGVLWPVVQAQAATWLAALGK